ncbi:hypothetical protein A3I18_01465 [Candidatus Campbellbacteria bacterium RIFCSPLOWO2_02_FULL_35_11]|uniref:Uncharacterized protein n=2 Tax=Candidatus Campbelliibacteriota TaxID=1752727 RepID=A0A1F5EQG8_9BACT|nr:MAG: hypothetical protein A3E89_00120 [Candidatus Campbellbacteria bacterium RIFCSPHIGHO2_12_FULL_35_10]OGD70793.1 MAG: hypothetical protein A3I18_01465 [Candidatus Campbellbacteria bacterium RIFCSPLOWO2_02_FULL_35_11]
MKNNKNLIIIIGILLICGITIFKYINNKNSQIDTGTTETTPESVLLDTSGWETCRNEEYGYEFKYPSNWYMYNSDESYGKESPIIVREGENCVGGYLFISSKKINYEDKEVSQTFGITVSNKQKLSGTIYSNSKSIEDYFSKATPEFRKAHIIEEKKVLDNKEVWWEKTKDGYILWLFNKESLVEIHFTNLNNELSNTILSTFKFIN